MSVENLAYMAGLKEGLTLHVTFVEQLCAEAFPHCSTEMEAVDLMIDQVYKRMQLKLQAKINATADVEFYYALKAVRDLLFKQKTEEALNGENVY